MKAIRLLALLSVAALAAAQTPLIAPTVWQRQESGTTAGLRGIYSVDGTVAWASGTGGTVLKTIDGGAHWMKCAVPDAAKDGATLDFRGVQAWDAETAIVMASGPGDKSRLYKTTDGCKTWALMLKNTDPDDFYDFFTFWDRKHGFLLGDPVYRMRIRNEPNTLEYHARKIPAPFVNKTPRLMVEETGPIGERVVVSRQKMWRLMERRSRQVILGFLYPSKNCPSAGQPHRMLPAALGLELAVKVAHVF
jgi:hypothetical protein